MPTPISVDDIQIGETLRAAVVDHQGRELMPAGRIITAFRLRKLKGARELFLADEAPPQEARNQLGDTAVVPPGRENHAAAEANLARSAATPAKAVASPPIAAGSSPPTSASSVAVAERADSSAASAPADAGIVSTPAANPSARTIAVSQFHVGMRLSEDIHDHDGLLLLAGGAEMTDRFLQLLKRRELDVVELRGGSASRSAAPDVSAIEAALESAVLARMPLLRYNGSSPATLARLSQTQLKAEVRRGLSFHQEAAAEVEVVYRELQSGLAISAGDLQEMFSDFAHYMMLDADLLALVVGGRGDHDEYLFNHGVDVALISMAIAGQMGLSPKHLAEIGLGAMLHDVGMLSVPNEIRLADRRLTPAEMEIVQQHPLHTLELLERVHDIPMVARTVAFQVHERCDGSGYPRGRKLTTIHPFARIVSIADQYAAMVRPRTYRAEHLPHHSVRDLLHAGAREKLDRSMLRAFVDRFSVFPVGSKVYLDHRIVGQVIRSNVGKHTQPVVVELDPDGRPTDRMIDLARCGDYRITKPGPLLVERAGL